MHYNVVIPLEANVCSVRRKIIEDTCVVHTVHCTTISSGYSVFILFFDMIYCHYFLMSLGKNKVISFWNQSVNYLNFENGVTLRANYVLALLQFELIAWMGKMLAKVHFVIDMLTCDILILNILILFQIQWLIFCGRWNKMVELCNQGRMVSFGFARSWHLVVCSGTIKFEVANFNETQSDNSKTKIISKRGFQELLQ